MFQKGPIKSLRGNNQKQGEAKIVLAVFMQGRPLTMKQYYRVRIGRKPSYSWAAIEGTEYGSRAGSKSFFKTLWMCYLFPDKHGSDLCWNLTHVVFADQLGNAMQALLTYRGLSALQESVHELLVKVADRAVISREMVSQLKIWTLRISMLWRSDSKLMHWLCWSS